MYLHKYFTDFDEISQHDVYFHTDLSGYSNIKLYKIHDGARPSF